MLIACLFSFTHVYFNQFYFFFISFLPSDTLSEGGIAACGDSSPHLDDRRALGITECPSNVGLK